MNQDDEGRYIIMEAEVQGPLFLFVNIYLPNSVQDQCRFYDKLNFSNSLIMNNFTIQPGHANLVTCM